MTPLMGATLARLPQFLLLAEQERFMHMGNRFREGADFDMGNLLMLLFALALVVGGAALLNRLIQLREARAFYHPRRLFGELCRVHGLDRPSRQLLLRIAQSQRLNHPAQLFVEPRRLAADRLPAGLRSQKREVEALRAKLFGDVGA